MFKLNIENCRSISRMIQAEVLAKPVVAEFESDETTCPVGKGRIRANIIGLHSNGSTRVDIQVRCSDCQLCRKNNFAAIWKPEATS